ncbi:TPA: hypothetical protein R4368_003583 [Yersinia enterocolitica]|uniref:hypothetical protein n=1 Tax=Yersinia enterocolitica TaxID=630 RepID=UPI002947AAF1|nr:hypothetical protein [Yersinia enterocolitica]HED4494103.1 hypothetical protein [Yersinia enterocolitica]
MKLKHDAICAELRSWAAETKQEIVAAEVAQAYFDLGGDELPLTPIEDEHATYNNKQRLFRCRQLVRYWLKRLNFLLMFALVCG